MRNKYPRTRAYLAAHRALSTQPDLPPTIVECRDDESTQSAVRCCFVGFPSMYSLSMLLTITELPEIELVGIITSTKVPDIIPTPNILDSYAAALSVPLFRTENINDDASLHEIHEMLPEVVIMASFDQIIKRTELLDLPRFGWFNIHPSLLPSYQGPEPIFWAIADAQTQAGLTLHAVTLSVDDGPILAQKRVKVDALDTADVLLHRIVLAAIEPIGTGILDAISSAQGIFPETNGNLTPTLAQSYRPPVPHLPLAQLPGAACAERIVRAGNSGHAPWYSDGDRIHYVTKAHFVTAGTPKIEESCFTVPFADGSILAIDTDHDVCNCLYHRKDCPNYSSDIPARVTPYLI